MAFPRAPGYNNLPNGVFSPTIFSQMAQIMFRKSSVAEDITNSDYFGEIASFGDSVRIIKEPGIAVKRYDRGTQVTAQDLDDEDFTLIVDQANYFAFKLDDIEEAHAHVNWMDMATDRAAYELRDVYDRDVLGYSSGYSFDETTGLWTAITSPTGTKADPGADDDEWFASRKLDQTDFGGGTAGNSIATSPDPIVGDATPLRILNRMNRVLDRSNVPQEGRWVVIDPVFKELLMDEDSKLVNADWSVGANGGEGLLNGRLSAGTIRGFRVYESNNLPFVGDGPETQGAGQATDYGIIVAGHDTAVATASQINQVEKFRDPDSFADICRGMQLYGRKILRPESLVRAIYNVA